MKKLIKLLKASTLVFAFCGLLSVACLIHDKELQVNEVSAQIEGETLSVNSFEFDELGISKITFDRPVNLYSQSGDSFLANVKTSSITYKLTKVSGNTYVEFTIDFSRINETSISEIGTLSSSSLLIERNINSIGSIGVKYRSASLQGNVLNLWVTFRFLDIQNPSNLNTFIYTDITYNDSNFSNPYGTNFSYQDIDDGYPYEYILDTTGIITTINNFYGYGLENGTGASSESYDEGYSDGYSAGSVAGYSSGFTNGSLVSEETSQQIAQQYYQNGYQDGYQNGSSEDETVSTIFSGILQVALVPINFFLAIFNFEILGINLSAFLKALFTVAITIIVIRMFIGGNSGGSSE